MKELEFLRQLLAHMGLESVEVEEEDRSGMRVLHVKVRDQDTGMVIGPRGEMLDALQKVVNLSARAQTPEESLESAPRVIVDVNGYRLRREDSVREMALDAAEEVAATGRPITLPITRSSERRLVHVALQDSTTVETRSDGDGRERRLTIYPKRAV